jgi:hypothetical protein
VSGNQQDVLILLIRQTHRAQEDAKGTRFYIQNEAHKPQKPSQGLDRNPSQYWTKALIDNVTPRPVLEQHPGCCMLTTPTPHRDHQVIKSSAIAIFSYRNHKVIPIIKSSTIAIINRRNHQPIPIINDRSQLRYKTRKALILMLVHYRVN